MFEWIIYKQDDDGRWAEALRLEADAQESDVFELGQVFAKTTKRCVSVAGADAYGIHAAYAFDSKGIRV